jgi:hypothetical protein
VGRFTALLRDPELCLHECITIEMREDMVLLILKGLEVIFSHELASRPGFTNGFHDCSSLSYGVLNIWPFVYVFQHLKPVY